MSRKQWYCVMAGHWSG